MASLATHLSLSLFLVPTGLTRLLRSTSLFLKNPSLFKSKPWFTTLSRPHWKNLDLFALALALPIAALSDAFLFTALRAHQAAVVLLLFWALVLSVAIRESVDFLRFAVNDGLVFVLAGVSFLSESWVAGNGNGIEGLSKDVYGLLGLLSLLCGACSLYLAVDPSSFWAEFLLSSGLVFQGTWVLQIGLSLYTDTFGFKGCGLNSKKAEGLGVVECELEEDGFRAVALARLLFVWHSGFVFGLGIASIGFLLLCQRRRSTIEGDQDGSLLPETSEMRNDGAELEME